MKKIYCASPLGFSEAGRFFINDILYPLIRECGIEIIDPWQLTPARETEKVSAISDHRKRTAAWQKLNFVIGGNNAQGIRGADMLLAVLDGSDVDSGTSAEIGYAAALGKKVLGYRSDFRQSGDNEGSRINLQVEYFIFQSGGTIAGSLQELENILKENSR
ncbi:MAG: nucleoside 2-deoxyribosyltransferase [Spirochaetota bacterium]